MYTSQHNTNKHLLTSCQSTCQNIKVSIITNDSDNVKLRLKEAYHIHKETPTINSKEECAGLTELLLYTDIYCNNFN